MNPLAWVTILRCVTGTYLLTHFAALCHGFVSWVCVTGTYQLTQNVSADTSPWHTTILAAINSPFAYYIWHKDTVAIGCRRNEARQDTHLLSFRKALQCFVTFYLSSRSSSMISDSVFPSTNREIFSIRLSASALCWTIPLTPLMLYLLQGPQCNYTRIDTNCS